MAGGTKMYMMEEEKDLMPMMCGDLFDHIDDLLDFPNDNNDVDDLIRMEGGMVDPSFTFTNGGGVPFTPAAGIPPLQNEPSLILPPLQADCDDGLIGGGEGGVMMANTGPSENTRATTTSTLNGEDDKVFENLDIADLEWFSNFIYDEADSFSLVTLPVPADIDGGDVKQDSIFRTSSPVSVLEPNSISGGGGGDGGSSASSASSSFSSSSCSGDNSGGRAAVPISPSHPVSTAPARARSKRRRTTTFSPRSHVSISFLPTHSSLVRLPAPEPESFGESSTGINPTMMKSAKKKKKKSNEEREGEEEVGPPAARRCTHCQIQKTPQWRAGPLGPKTLCNACGVRYKSGRLFPEYRPAASPTFVPSIHSNSHKKVVEMRLVTSTLPGAAPPKSCDLLDYIRRRE